MSPFRDIRQVAATVAAALRQALPFRAVRWPDGRVVSFAVDRIALALKRTGAVFTVVWCVLVFQGRPVVVLGAMLVALMVIDSAARWRLASCVNRAQTAPAPMASAPKTIDIRIGEHGVKRYRRKSAQLRERANAAEQRGDARAARRLRCRADKCAEAATTIYDATYKAVTPPELDSAASDQVEQPGDGQDRK